MRIEVVDIEENKAEVEGVKGIFDEDSLVIHVS